MPLLIDITLIEFLYRRGRDFWRLLNHGFNLFWNLSNFLYIFLYYKACNTLFLHFSSKCYVEDKIFPLCMRAFDVCYFSIDSKPFIFGKKSFYLFCKLKIGLFFSGRKREERIKNQLQEDNKWLFRERKVPIANCI